MGHIKFSQADLKLQCSLVTPGHVVFLCGLIDFTKNLLQPLTFYPESLNEVMRTFLGSGNLACFRVEEANGVKLPIHKEEEVVGTLFKTLKQI